MENSQGLGEIDELDSMYESELDAIEIGKIKLVVNYKAMPLESDGEYMGDTNMTTIKKFTFHDEDDLDDKLGLMREYVKELCMDKNIKVLKWRIVCEMNNI